MINENSTAFFLSITNGRKGTAMPPFGNRLSENQRWDVTAYIWTFWADQDSAGKGKLIYERNCTSCHGMKGDGAEISIVFNGKRAFDFTNLSAMANEHPSELFDSVTDGVTGTAMPSWKSELSENERWNVIKYAWTFQFKDYAIAPSQTPIPSTGIPSKNSIWYSTPAGAAIILISLIMAAGILYLFRKGVDER
ncbi:MAG: cytochrome c [Candidatus Methanoperedens sp.]|nr:cytochrome c [Candidatus Methanoperedens sp.]